MKKFNSTVDLLSGLAHIKTALSKAELDVFIDKEALLDILYFYSEYSKTHEVEINEALDRYNEGEDA